jgi:hypothetical protein
MVKIIVGFIFCLVGFFILAKTESMLSNFGRIDFFERHFGTEGGSRLGYKLIALIITFIGVLLMTGLYESFLYWFLGPLINMMKGGGF